MKRTLIGLTGLIALLSSSLFAHAGRSGPSPLLVQFDQGYGVVAVEVIKATPTTNKYPFKYTTKFKVVKIVAQPAHGKKFEFKPGQKVQLEMTVGYAALIEDWGLVHQGGGPNATRQGGPLATGSIIYLTIMLDSAGGLQHAPGASAVRVVKKFTDEDLLRFATIGKVAALPMDKRTKKCMAIIGDPKASEALRMDILIGMRESKPFVHLASESRTLIAKQLLGIWNDPKAKLSSNVLTYLDYLLVNFSNKTFDASADRRRVWLDRIYAGFPTDAKARAKAVHARDSLPHMLMTLAKYDKQSDQSQSIADRIIAEIKDTRKWPAQYRWRLSGVLLKMYRESAEPNSKWATALNAYYPDAIEHADGWMLRLIPTGIKHAVSEPRYQGKRKFIPKAATFEALQKAIKRMQAQAKAGKGDSNTQSAIVSMNEGLKALGSVKDD